MISRRHFVAGAIAGTASRLAWAKEPIEIITADVRPLSIAQGERKGVVLEVIQEALRTLDMEPRFTFLPFAQAMQRVQATPGAMMTPLARSPEREAGFTWIAKVIDVPQAMGTLRGKPVVDLQSARSLARVAVVKGGVQQGFLKAQGFTNLVEVDAAREIAQMLADSAVDAWYGTATEIAIQFEAIGKPGLASVGPAIQNAPVWLGGNLQMGAVPVKAISRACAELEANGSIQRIYRSYVPG